MADMPMQDPYSIQTPYTTVQSSLQQRDLSSAVATASPELFAAASRTSITREDRNLIEGWSQIKNMHQNLMRLSNKDAQAKFESLDPQTQAWLKQYYNVDYANKGEGAAAITNETQRRLLGLDSGVNYSMAYKSPLRFLLEAAGQYGRLINMPYAAAQQALVNGASLSNSKVWDLATEGQFNYDENVTNDLIAKHGGALSFTALHILAGMTPGEIIDAWGPGDAEIINAVNTMFNKPEEFQSVLDEFDKAKLSPGRDIARWVNKTFNIHDEKKTLFKAFGKNVTLFDLGSGAIDMAFQIFADPMTYATGGLSALGKGVAGLNKAEKLAKALSESQNIGEHLAKPEVARYWTGYTKQIGNYADAVNKGDNIAAAKIQDRISRKYAMHGTSEEVNFWAASGVKDLDSFASLIDRDPSALQKIIRGRTSDNMYAREGAAYASTSRTLKTNIKNKISELLVGKKGFDVLKNTSIDTLAKDLITGGQTRSYGHTYDEAVKFIGSGPATTVQKRLGYLSSIHPGKKIVYTNDDAVLKSLDTFRNQANLLFENKAVGESLTQYFLASSQAERFAIKRGLDELTMRKMGIHGVEGGEQLIRDTLDAMYGGFGARTFGATEKLTRPQSIKTLSRATQHLTDDVNVMGPLHQSQIREGVSPLPYETLSQYAAKVSLKDLNKFNALPKLIGGAFESKAMASITSLWSLLVLAPMLGIRTAIDEAFFAGLTTKGEVAAQLRQASKAGKLLAAYTNDKSAIGPVKHLMQKTMDEFSPKTRAAYDSIPFVERQSIMEKHLDQLFNGHYYETYADAKAGAEKEIFDKALMLFGDGIAFDNVEHIRHLSDINPSILQTTSAQSVVETLLPTRNIINADKPIIDPSKLDIALDDFDAKATGVFNIRSVANMTDAHIDLAMFKNFWARFTGGGIKVKGVVLPKTDIARLFIENNGLRTPKNVDNALGTFMEGMGFYKQNGKWVLGSSHLPTVDAFLNSSRHYMQYFNSTTGNHADAVSQIAMDLFTDMYHVFHGSSDQFNEKLLKAFDDFKWGKVGSHRDIIRKMKFDDYRELIKDHKATDRIVTDVELGGGTDLESKYAKFLHQAFEMMSRQTNDIIRQPIVLAHYFAYRSEYAKWGAKYVPQMAKKLVDNGMDVESAMYRAQEMFDRQITQGAIQNAADHVLKYADNPEIRTVFAYNMKTVGRFYRAVEDQWRRTARVYGEHKVGALYRMRLMQQGLASVGAVHNDANGEQYVIMPMDDVIYGAVNKGLNVLTQGNVGINQPLFNDLTFKLTAGNPSFQTDAGMPYLSGPAGSLSVLAVKSLLGKFDPTKNLAEDLDNAALGDLGDNVSLTSIVTPKIVRSMMKMNTVDQNTAEEVSAFTQALSYYQAHNLAPNEADYTTFDKYDNPTIDMEAFNKAKRKYLDNVRIAAHSIITTRALLGLMLPVSFQGKDFKDLPDYLKHGDVTSMSASFYQVLKEVESKYPDIGDPYEVALATWTGNNPGKLPYLVSKNLNEVKPMLTYSKKMQDWAIANDGAVKTFGNGALIFAPHIGQFNAGVWAWAEAADLTPKVPRGMTTGTYIENYFDDLRLRKYTNAYYDTYNQENNELKNIPINFTDQRRATTEHYKNVRKQLQLSVPGLKDYIDSSRDNKANVEFVNQVYDYVNSGIADAPKGLLDSANQMYELYQGFMQYANTIDQQNYQNGSDIKRAEKLRILAQMDSLIKADTSGTLKTFFQYGLQPLMNSVSRDTNSSITRNVVK